MSICYVCAPCRRKLSLQWLHHRCPKWHRNASVVPLPSSSPSRPPRSKERADAKHVTSNGPSRDPRRPSDLLPLRYDHTVEDDFLDRLFNDRDPLAGPYSNPHRNDSSPRASNSPDSRGPRKQEAHQRRLQDFSSASRKRSDQNAIELRQLRLHKHLAAARPLQSQVAINPFDPGQESASGVDDVPFYNDWAAQHGKEEMARRSPSHTDPKIRLRGTSQEIRPTTESAPETPARSILATIRRLNSEGKALPRTKPLRWSKKCAKPGALPRKTLKFHRIKLLTC